MALFGKCREKVIVIGISGTTNSGKSTLTSMLKKEVPNSGTICQDHYFLEPGDERLNPLYIPDLDHHNWEDYRSLEMDRMVDDLKKSIAKAEQTKKGEKAFIFVEGYSLFGWRPLTVFFDKKYFIKVDKGICHERRKQRNYNPADKPGYFEEVVWPMYQQHLELIANQEDIEYVDGSENINNIFLKIKQDLEKFRDVKPSKKDA